jgi:hypothetical protein
MIEYTRQYCLKGWNLLREKDRFKNIVLKQSTLSGEKSQVNDAIKTLYIRDKLSVPVPKFWATWW